MSSTNKNDNVRTNSTTIYKPFWYACLGVAKRFVLDPLVNVLVSCCLFLVSSLLIIFFVFFYRKKETKKKKIFDNDFYCFSFLVLFLLFLV